MSDSVIFPDPERWLVAHIYSRLAGFGMVAKVVHQWPEPLPEGPVVVVRYDGGPQESLVTEASGYGFTILGDPDDTDGEATMTVARTVRHIVQTCWGVDGPFADCRESSGPARVPNTFRPERYFTATLITVGSPA